MKLLQGVIKENFLFLIFLVVFALTPIVYFSYVPIWDGFQFVKLCYLPESISLLSDCANHSAPFNNLLFGILQKIDGSNLVFIYIENILLGIVGLVFFYLLLEKFFGDRISRYERALITFLFGFHPVFLAHIVQPSLDYVLPIYAVVLLYLLLDNYYVWASVMGIVLAFTKEPGLMVYGVCVFLYFYVFAGFGKRLEIVSKYRNTVWALVAPFVLFAIYAHFFTLQAGKGYSIILEMFTPNETPDFFIEQVQSIAIINFYWIVTMATIIGVFFIVLNYMTKKPDIEHLSSPQLKGIYIFLCTVSILWFNTRIEFFNNPRYMLLWVPFLVLSFASVYVCVEKKRFRLLFLSVLVSLIYASAFNTFDPVSKIIYPTFQFGSHTMLATPISRNIVGYEYTGKDTLVYNFQFTAFDFIVTKAIQTYGLDKNYVMSRLFLGGIDTIFTSFDASTKKRTFFGPPENSKAIHVNVMDRDQAYQDTAVQDIYFIEMPGHESEKTLKSLGKDFVAVATSTVEDRGYAANVIHMVRK